MEKEEMEKERDGGEVEEEDKQRSRSDWNWVSQELHFFPNKRIMSSVFISLEISSSFALFSTILNILCLEKKKKTIVFCGLITEFNCDWV